MDRRDCIQTKTEIVIKKPTFPFCVHIALIQETTKQIRYRYELLKVESGMCKLVSATHSLSLMALLSRTEKKKDEKAPGLR